MSYLTKAAKNRLRRLIRENDAAGVLLRANSRGFDISLTASKLPVGCVVLETTPRIFTDLRTFRMFERASLDYEAASAEFIFTTWHNYDHPCRKDA